MTNHITKLYISAVKKQLPIISPSKKAFLRTLKQNINNHIAEHPDTTYECVVTNFGTPEEVVSSFYESLDSDEISQQLHRKRKITLICCILFCTLILLCGWYQHQMSQTIQYYEFEEIDIDSTK